MLVRLVQAVRTGGEVLLDRMLPARLRPTDQDRQFRAELVAGFGLFELLVFLGFGLTELAWGTAVLGMFYLVGLLPLAAILAMLRRDGQVERAGNRLLALLFAFVTVSILASGGRVVGATLVVPTFVLFAVLISPAHVGWRWAVALLADVLLAAVLRFQAPWDFPVIPDPRWVASVPYRVSFIFGLGALLIGLLARRAMRRFRADLERARAAEALARAEATANADRFRDFADIAADGFWETDAQLRLTYVSPSFAAAIGLPAQEMLGRTPAEAYRARFPSAPDLAAYMAPLAAHAAFSDQVLQTRGRDGAPRLLHNEGMPRFDAQGRFAGYRGVVRDVTERERLARELRHLADHDPLTGLANRRTMHEALQRALAAGEGARHWVCAIDLDGFKAVNDQVGHAGGDEVLRRFARLLAHCTRAGETLARMGGDEFLLLLADTDADGARAVAERILARIGEAAVEWQGAPLGPGASIGLAGLRAGEPVEALLMRVDAACYASKRGGRNRVSLAAP